MTIEGRFRRGGTLEVHDEHGHVLRSIHLGPAVWSLLAVLALRRGPDGASKKFMTSDELARALVRHNAVAYASSGNVVRSMNRLRKKIREAGIAVLELPLLEPGQLIPHDDSRGYYLNVDPDAVRIILLDEEPPGTDPVP
jgi:hypothetical protein